MQRTWITIIVLVAGLVLGPSSLSSAKAAQPPIDWDAIPFVLVGATVTAVFVIGIQVLRRDPKFGRMAINLFIPISVFMLGSGLGAFATGALRGEWGATSYFFLAIGVGLVIGVATSRFLDFAKFKHSL